jgi:hypothetical protein
MKGGTCYAPKALKAFCLGSFFVPLPLASRAWAISRKKKEIVSNSQNRIASAPAAAAGVLWEISCCDISAGCCGRRT